MKIFGKTMAAFFLIAVFCVNGSCPASAMNVFQTREPGTMIFQAAGSSACYVQGYPPLIHTDISSPANYRSGSILTTYDQIMKESVEDSHEAEDPLTSDAHEPATIFLLGSTLTYFGLMGRKSDDKINKFFELRD